MVSGKLRLRSAKATAAAPVLRLGGDDGADLKVWIARWGEEISTGKISAAFDMSAGIISDGSKLNDDGMCTFGCRPAASSGGVLEPFPTLVVPLLHTRMIDEGERRADGRDARDYQYSPQIDTIRSHASSTSSPLTLYTGSEFCSHHTEFYLRKLCTISYLLKNTIPENYWLSVQDVDLFFNREQKGSILESVINPVTNSKSNWGLSSSASTSLILLKRHTNEYCAGIYLIKNNDFGKEFIDLWLRMLEDSYETEKNVNGDNGILHQVLLSLQNSERKCEALFTESKYIKKYLPCFHSTLKPNSRIKYLTKEKSYASELFYTCKEGECHPTVYRREGTFFVHGLKIFNQEEVLNGNVEIEWVDKIDMKRVNGDYETFKSWRDRRMYVNWLYMFLMWGGVVGGIYWIWRKRGRRKWRRV
ncbi:hypothetical protein TL16_g12943 [Triparma laevis f. inornata]|uniref:Uncharacterized protein n=1 Tax=Triparma laevis f. inornata TaxID=1714386 RepID=A0A9W7BQE1_9STRA|nr:hypothetical protein TL16_g12943 [Triparma laevis f. inornata]